jgi:hypothetical protein
VASPAPGSSESIEAKDAKTVHEFFHQESKFEPAAGGGKDCFFMSTCEYKHKGERVPVSVANHIIAHVLKGK